ncbi:MAG: SLBB domain-containing protein [Treponema sp.]|nr:SLBB domain-containing protein [Treponema sp.]
MNKKYLLAACLSLSFCLSLFAQGLTPSVASVSVNATGEKEGGAESVQMVADPQLAMSVPDYPVTSGDVYTLVFAAGGAPVQYTIPVDTTYKVRVANLGVLNGKGLTYNQLKAQVDALVSKNYPMGGVQFVLTSPAVFLISISGEVNRATERKAWALTRLSSFVSTSLTSYSSTRNISVISSDGKKRSYDLYKARRDGDFSQDPYLRPGDKIIINRYERKVTIGGAVERPGTYEILKGENLKTLIDLYGNGLTEYADTSRIVLRRINNSFDQAGDTVYLDKDVIQNDFVLENADSITISSRIELRDTLFFEGAVGSLGLASQNNNGDSSDANNINNPIINRIPVQFLAGENYATLIRRNSGNFFPTSDLRNAYIIRDGQKIPLNLEDVLYNKDYMSDYRAQKSDTLYVPYLQTTSTVLITGEVTATAEVDAWPLKRLSTLIHDRLTAYSSLRNVTVTGIDGTVFTYDIFQANRTGDMNQNPYIRPGETITVNRLDRKVSIAGAVERPGSYELLPGENLKTLIETYGNGLTEYADTSRVVLRRINNSSDKAGDTIYLAKDVVEKDYALENAVAVTIPSRIELRDTVFFEGAVGALGRESQNNTTDNEKNNVNNPIINRIPVQFLAGENYATLIRRNGGVFFPTSDLRNAYITRNGQKIPINLEDVLYNKNYMSDYVALQNDTLYVPYRQTTSTVLIIGEVTATAEVDAWPLKRLSTLVHERQTAYSSMRNVMVTAIDGTVTTYDLFLASRFGDMDQNPYVRPGETVTVNRIDRKVTINGAVERPGTYELLEGENLKDLIEYYGNGLAPLADISRIELYRSLTGEEGSGKKSYLNKKHVAENFELICYDVVEVSSYSDLMPAIFVEGAIGASDNGELEASNRIAASYNDGEDYAYFVRRNREWFSAVSDVANAYIIRGSDKIPIDLSSMLYDASFYSNIPIQKNDILMVPFRQYFVTVSGAVKNPGRFPYIPDRTYDYYVGLAGGFDKTKNKLDSVRITDMNNKKQSKDDFIGPEYTIEAKTNSFLFYFNQYAPVITSVLSIFATSLSAYAVVRSME